MRYFFMSFLSLFILEMGFSQNFEWGKTMESTASDYGQQVLIDNNNIYVFKHEKLKQQFDLIVDKLDLNGKLLSSTKVVGDMDGLKIPYRIFEYNKDFFFPMGKESDGKMAEYSLYKVNPIKAELKRGVVIEKVKKKKKRVQIGCRVSANSNYLATFMTGNGIVLNELGVSPVIDPENSTIRVLNKVGEVVWTQEVTLGSKEVFVEVVDYEVNNEGEVFVLVKFDRIKRTKNENGIKNSPYVYLILKYNKNFDEPIVHELSIENRYVYNALIEMNEQNNLFCVGKSSDNEGNIDGLFGFKMLDGSNKIEFVSDNRILEKDLTDEKSLNKQVDISAGYTFEKIHFRKNGGYFVVGGRTTTIGDSRGDFDTLIGHIIVASISKDGNIEWLKTVSRQGLVGAHPHRPPIFSELIDDNLVLAYMTSKQMSKFMTKAQMYNSNAKMVIIDSTGEEKTTSILEGYSLMEFSCKKINDKKILLKMKKKGKTMAKESVVKYGVVSFD